MQASNPSRPGRESRVAAWPAGSKGLPSARRPRAVEAAGPPLAIGEPAAPAARAVAEPGGWARRAGVGAARVRRWEAGAVAAVRRREPGAAAVAAARVRGRPGRWAAPIRVSSGESAAVAAVAAGEERTRRRWPRSVGARPLPLRPSEEAWRASTGPPFWKRRPSPVSGRAPWPTDPQVSSAPSESRARPDARSGAPLKGSPRQRNRAASKGPGP